MSANLIIDIRHGAQYQLSVTDAPGVASSPSSGTLVGNIVDLGNADTYCNVFMQGGPSSGIQLLQVQVSDDTVSGNFGDPTSGLLDFPPGFISGGIMVVNSGLWASGNPNGPPVNNAPLFCSGGIDFANFQRTQRYARIIALSGTFNANVTAGFISQRLTTGSGFGYTLAPGSGTISV